MQGTVHTADAVTFATMPLFCCCECTQLGAAFVLDVMVQLAHGVAHLHSCGILHRDLKADNALIQSLDPLVVKWGDYGCAVQLGRNKYGDGRDCR